MTDRDVLRRQVTFPPDLFPWLEQLAQKNGYLSVQAWIVTELQTSVRREVKAGRLKPRWRWLKTEEQAPCA